jgi:hypothetical protein
VGEAKSELGLAAVRVCRLAGLGVCVFRPERSPKRLCPRSRKVVSSENVAKNAMSDADVVSAETVVKKAVLDVPKGHLARNLPKIMFRGFRNGISPSSNKLLTCARRDRH